MDKPSTMTGDKSTNPNDAESFVRVEHQAIQQQALQEDWQELSRRRGELQVALRAALQQTEAESQELAHALVALHESLGALSKGPAGEGETPDATGIRQMRRCLHDAGIQLAMFERRRSHDQGTANNLASLSFGELWRLGLGLFLPLMVALIVAALIVAVGLELALGVP